MEPIYFNTFVARTEVAARLQNYRRQRITLDSNRLLDGAVHLGKRAFAMITQFMKSLVIDLQKILDSQHACQPGGLTMAECLPVTG